MKKGHQVTILTSFPHYRKGRSETWPQYRGKLYEWDTWKGARVLRTYVFAPKFSSNWLGVTVRALNFVSFFLSALIAALFLAPSHVIFVPSSPPMLGALVGGLAGAVKGVPFVYGLQDIFPEIAVQSGVIRESLLTRMLQRFERIVYGRAAQINVISESMKGLLIRKGVEEDRISVISNFCDTAFMRPMPRDNAFGKQHKLEGSFVAMFAGNIGMVQSVACIIEAADLLKHHAHLLFVFVGRGENRDNMERLARDKGLGNVRFLPLQPHANMPTVMASADVGLVTLQKGLSLYATPSKIFTIMSAGRAVIAMIDEGSEVWRMVEEARCGVCVRPEDSSGLADAILKLSLDREETRRMGVRARRHVEENFTRQATSASYEGMFLKAAGLMRDGVALPRPPRGD